MFASLDRPLRLDAAGYDRAATALARAFFDYSLMVYASPEAGRRARGVSALYDALLADSFRHGEVYVTPDGAGVACWLPPERGHLTFWRQLRAGMLSVPLRFGPAAFRRLLAYDTLGRALHREHAPMPHWYLSAIGVEPERQGQGVAATLMQPILQRADAAGLPCYLETHQEANVRIYQKHFDLCTVTCLPASIWAMLRRPRDRSLVREVASPYRKRSAASSARSDAAPGSRRAAALATSCATAKRPWPIDGAARPTALNHDGRQHGDAEDQSHL